MRKLFFGISIILALTWAIWFIGFYTTDMIHILAVFAIAALIFGLALKKETI